MKGAELIVKTLERYGVSHIFGLPGDATPFFRALQKSRIKFVTMRTEQGAGYAANGYARTAGVPGVVYVSRGAGGTNVLTGMACAYLEGTPILFIVDQVSRKQSIYPQSYMFVKLDEIYGPVSKGVDVIWSAKDIPNIMAHAWADVKSKTMGPRVIVVPQDVFNDETKPVYLDSSPVVEEKVDTPEALNILCRNLNKSNFPVIILGPGVKEFTKSEELQSFLKLISVPFFTARHAKGIISEMTPFNYGVVRSDVLSALFPKIDLVITLGFNTSDKDDEYAWWLDSTKIKHLDITDAPPIETPCFRPTERLKVNWQEFFRCANKTKFKSYSNKFLISAQEWQKRCRKSTLERFGGSLLGSVLNNNYLGGILTPDDFLITETGLTRRYLLTAFQAHGPGIVGSMTLSALGFSIPAAIGVSIANPKACVTALCGDGALFMSIAELATIRHLNLPIKILCVADESYGYMKYLQQEAFGGTVGVDFTNPNFKLLAKAFGFRFVAIRQESDLGQLHSCIADRTSPALIVLHQKYKYCE